MYKLKYKYLFFTGLFILFSTDIISQNSTSENTFWSDVRFGGNIGLSFGDGFFSGTLAPSAIYQFNPYFSMGIGLNGTYASLRNEYKSTILGGGIIALTNPYPEIQISAEFEELNVNRKYDGSLGFADENYWYPALFLGAGYNTGYVTVGIRYDVLYDRDKSIYNNAWAPFVRVYF